MYKEEFLADIKRHIRLPKEEDCYIFPVGEGPLSELYYNVLSNIGTVLFENAADPEDAVYQAIDSLSEESFQKLYCQFGDNLYAFFCSLFNYAESVHDFMNDLIQSKFSKNYSYPISANPTTRRLKKWLPLLGEPKLGDN